MDNNPNWSKKFMQVLQHAQEELKKTTEIGKKMISASKTSSELHELYEGFVQSVTIRVYVYSILYLIVKLYIII